MSPSSQKEKEDKNECGYLSSRSQDNEGNKKVI